MAKKRPPAIGLVSTAYDHNVINTACSAGVWTQIAPANSNRWGLIIGNHNFDEIQAIPSNGQPDLTFGGISIGQHRSEKFKFVDYPSSVQSAWFCLSAANVNISVIEELYKG